MALKVMAEYRKTQTISTVSVCVCLCVVWHGAYFTVCIHAENQNQVSFSLPFCISVPIATA